MKVHAGGLRASVTMVATLRGMVREPRQRGREPCKRRLVPLSMFGVML